MLVMFGYWVCLGVSLGVSFGAGWNLSKARHGRRDDRECAAVMRRADVYRPMVRAKSAGVSSWN
jgi:hypothetical protein